MTFNVAAASYDRFMGEWSSQLSGPFADFARVRAGQRVLDVGCGPGALTSLLVARLGSEAVAAADPSETFVAAARDRLPGVDVRCAPAESLPYPDASFDAALAQLVVHFMADPVAGIREMARVVRPGGVVAASVWDFGGDRGPLGPFWEAVRELDPTSRGEADLAGARKGHLVELFEEAGLHQVEEAELTVSRAFASFNAWWELFSHSVGPAGAHVASLDPDGRQALLDRCRAMLPAGSFALHGVAWAARGVRPG